MNQTPNTQTMTPAQFERTLKLAERMLANQKNVVRNVESNQRTLDGRFAALRAALKAELYDDDSTLYAFLEANPKVADRFARFERRMLGMPV